MHWKVGGTVGAVSEEEGRSWAPFQHCQTDRLDTGEDVINGRTMAETRLAAAVTRLLRVPNSDWRECTEKGLGPQLENRGIIHNSLCAPPDSTSTS